jgi:hypothetical protein
LIEDKIPEKEQINIHDDLTLSRGDYLHTSIKAVASMVPCLGGPVAEFFSLVISAPLEKRRDEWLIRIYNGLKNLESIVDGFKIEKLRDNEQFISTLLYATTIAMRTHREEKLEALKNTVLNSTLSQSIDDNIHLIFLNLIDRFTPLHLMMLDFFKDPRKFGENRGIRYTNWNIGGISSIIDEAFPELKGKDKFYEQIVMDLSTCGLIQHIENPNKFLNTTMTSPGMFGSRITEMGKNFLNYVSSPII